MAAKDVLYWWGRKEGGGGGRGKRLIHQKVENPGMHCAPFKIIMKFTNITVVVIRRTLIGQVSSLRKI